MSTNINSTSFCVTFDPPTNITQNGLISSYTVTYQGELFNTTLVNTSVSVNTTYPLTESSIVCISGLEEYNNYTVLIRANNGAGEGAAAMITVITSDAAPDVAPQNVNGTTLTPTSITVCFVFPAADTQNGLITSFNVTLVGSPFDTDSRTDNIPIISSDYPMNGSICTNITGLEEYNNYNITVVLINSAGSSPISDSIPIQTTQAVSTVPLNLMSENINSTSFCVTFYPPTNISQNGLISSYTVTYQGELFNTTLVSTSVSVNTTYPLTESSIVCITGLEEYNDYTVTIRAINGAGEGAAAMITVMTLEAAPDVAPQNVTGSNPIPTPTSINVCFDFPAENTQNGIINSFNVTLVGSPFDTGPRTYSIAITFPVYPMTGTICSNIIGLQEYNNYTITVVLINSAGSSPSSDPIFIETAQAVSTVPLNLTSTNITATSFCVTFNPPTNITQNGPISNYTVTYQGELFNTTEGSTSVSVNTSYPLTESSNVCITGLEEYNNYIVTIRANNGAGEGAAAMITVMTSEAAPGVAPLNVNSPTPDATSITVCFDYPAGDTQNGIITSFNVTLVGSPFDTISRTDNILTTSTDYPMNGSICTNITGLQEYNNYTITVVLINSAGSSPISDSTQVQTLEAVSAVPLNLMSENINTTSFCVTFDPPTNISQNGLISSYTVTYQGELFNMTEVSTSVSVNTAYPLTESSSVCISGLEEYNNYTVLIRAINGAGEGDAAMITVMTSEAVPDVAPQNVTVSTPTPTSITVCFDFPAGNTQNGLITSYNVTLVGSPFDTNSSTYNILITSTDYPMTGSICSNITGLQEYNNYNITVVLINSAGSSPSSDSIRIETPEAVPAAAPVNVTLRTISSQIIEVTICPPAPIQQNGLITNYTVSYTGDPFDTSTQIQVFTYTLSYPAVECTVSNLTGLEEYNNYTVTARAVNSAGSSNLTTPVATRTLQAVSTIPLNLMSTNITTTSFCVTFDPPINITQNGPISSYTVTYQGDLFNTTLVSTSVSVSSPYPLTESSSVCISGLEEYNNYTVLIRAINGAGEGAAAMITVLTLEAVADEPPQNVTAVTLNSTAIEVCFYPPPAVNQNGPITSFSIIYSGNPFETSPQNVTIVVSPVEYPLTGMLCENLTTLQEFNNYTITVVAVNMIGDGQESDDVFARTDEAAPSAAPQNFTAGNGLSIPLAWMDPPPIEQNGVLGNFSIEYFGVERDTDLKNITVPPTQFNINITGLEADTKYMFRIRASTIVGVGPFTDDIQATTQEAAPSSPPVNITVTVINSTALNSTWRIPDIDEHNGALESVEIRLQGIDILTSQMISVPITNRNDTTFKFTILSPLEEYVNYSVIFAVENAIGLSPFSDPVFVRTEPAAPSNTPQNVTAVALSATSIGVMFYPPPEIDQNGPITMYNISYIGETFDTANQFETVNFPDPIYPATAPISFNLTGLQEYNNYTISVRAINDQGMSAFTIGVIQLTAIAAPNDTPQNVTTETLSATSIRVMFDPPPEIDQNGPDLMYNISYIGQIFDTTPQSVVINAPNSDYPAVTRIYFNLTGLEEYTNYTISVRAFNGEGTSEYTVGVVRLTEIAVPSNTPTIIFQSVTINEIVTMISPPNGIDQNGPIISYEIRIYTSLFNIQTVFRNVTFDPLTYPLTENTGFTATGLEEFVTYNLTVRAYTSAGPGEFSTGILQRTNPTAPDDTPQNVTAVALSGTSIGVMFYPPPGVDQNGLITMYNISYIGETFQTANQFQTVNFSNPDYPATEPISVNLTGLQEYNNYTISVRAINAQGTSEYTDGVMQLTDIAAPSDTPQNVTTETLSAISIRVMFDPPPEIDQNGPDLMYNISYTGEIFDTTPQSVVVNAPNSDYPAVTRISVDLTGLQEYTNYTISVRAFNGEGTSEYTDGVVQLTDIAAPNDTPQNVTAVALSATSIGVMFYPPPGIDQNGPITMYNIRYIGETFETFNQFETVNFSIPIYPATAPISFNLTGLEEYNNYTISVRAINVEGTSEYTDGIVQLTDEAVSAAPTDLSVTSGTPTQICVQFINPPAINQNGLIDRYFVNLSSFQISGPSNRTCYISNSSCYTENLTNIIICFNGVDEGTTYVVSVRVGNGAGLGAPSETREIITEGVAPPDEEPFTSDNVTQETTSTSITLNIPDVPVSLINSPAIEYLCLYQGILYEDNVFSTNSRRRRQSNRVVIAMTPVISMTFPINGGNITLVDLLPNYEYEVDVAIGTAYGQTPFVTILSPTLAAIAPEGPPIGLAAIAITAPAGSLQMSLQVSFRNDFITLNGALQSFNIFYQISGETEQQTQYLADGDPGPYQRIITDLLPNTEYFISINVVTLQGTSSRSSVISSITYPLEPSGTPVEPTPTSTTNLVQYTAEIQVPTQNLFETANIEVIFIIADYNNPEEFTGYSLTRRFEAVHSNITETNGYIFGADDETTRIRIQAALGSVFFNRAGNYFAFIIGSEEETTYNGITFTNPPLVAGTTVSYSYYILFLNENMETSAEFTILSVPISETIPAVPDSPIGIIVALLLIIVILAVVIIVLVLVIIWYMRRRKNSKPASRRHSSIMGKMSRKFSQNKTPGPEGNGPENINPLLPPPVIMKSTISLQSFAKYVEGMGANDRLKFHEEYMSIKDPPHTHDMCSMSANGPRNRYRDIRTYDHSRITLTIIDGDEYSDYINANFIHGYYKKNEYIAAQGPLDNTIADFWRMTWDWNVPTIVMLTKCVERGRRKCSQYWPDKGTTTYSFYDSTGSSRELVDVTVERETTYAHYIIREIVITRIDVPNQQKRITQWHYTSWPDMGVPENGTSLLKFVQKVHQAHPRDSGPMIVHCSAGVGRTGTFITLGCMMPMIREQSLVDVYNFVNRMRDSRNRMVQVEAQYVFIHEALLEFIQHGDTEVAGEDLDTYFRSLDMEEESGVSKLLGQFKRLAYPVRPTEYSIAQSAQNKAKNRYVNILPYNHKRVKLTPVPGVENSDYINASYIDGYWIKNAFIATQGPLQGTIEDFWKMIWEQHVNTIVMLTSEVEAGRERCVHYWPDEQPEYYGPIMVELLDTKMDEENEFIIHELKVTQTKENRTRKLHHFQYTGWHEREMPDAAKGLNNMIGDIEQWTRNTNPTHPIVVHCSAGVGRTGVFIGAYNMMESIRHENTVDVFNSVRMMRYQRPAMVQTATQYRFCYLSLIDYISSESNSVYQNVPKM